MMSAHTTNTQLNFLTRHIEVTKVVSQHHSRIQINCSIFQARTLCLSIGFTMAFGAMFSKTWRVYKIFTNKKLLKVVSISRNV